MFSILKKNHKKIIEFYSSFIAGSFSGLIFGVLFSSFKEWTTYNLGHNLGLSIGALFCLVISYFIGFAAIKFILSHKEIFTYTLNFISGFLSSLFVGSILFFEKNKCSIIFITSIIILLFFSFLWFIIKHLKRNNK